MGNWSERVYNKDGHFKYIQPLTEGVLTSEGRKHYDYLYALQGSRYAHRVYTIRNRFALLDAQYVAGTYRADSFAAYFGYKFSEDKRKIRITASERYYFGYGYTSGTPKQSAVLAADAGSTMVSGPGQNRSAKRRQASGTRRTSGASSDACAICTMSGLSDGRPFAL